jgi:hypothetical protein
VGEDLSAVAADVDLVPDGVLDPAGDRDVRSDA